MFITTAGGGAIVGGVLGMMGGSKGGGGSTVQQQTLDPRMNEAIYGSSGIVPTMSNWYKQNSSGLNAQMVQGLNQQYQTLNDPFTQQGYNRMGQNGYNLMGGAVAGNPFTSGQASLGGGFGGFGGGMGGGDGGGMPMALAPQTQSSSGWGGLGLSNGPFQMPAAPAPQAAPEAAPAVQSFAEQMAQWQRDQTRYNRENGGGR